MKPYLKRRISRRVGRIRYRTTRALKKLGRGIRLACRALIPLGGLALIAFAMYTVNTALGLLVAGVELLMVDWWIEHNSSNRPR